MSILLIILGLIIFVGLVVVHELGHFIAARRGGVEVEEFGIGFPPRAWKRKIGKGKDSFLFSINWLPLGGFVKLKGEHDADTEPGTFGAASIGTKTKIMLAGVAMNLLTAYLLLTFLAIVGIPKLVENQFTVASDTKIVKNQVLVGNVEEGSPAEKAGLKIRDQITAISGPDDKVITIDTQEKLPQVTANYAGQPISVNITRRGEQTTISTTLRTKQEVEASKLTDNPKGYLGISPTEYTLTGSTWSAPIVAGGVIKQFTQLTFQGLGKALGALFEGNTKTASEQVAGPLGIFALIKTGSLLGYQFILMLMAIISLTLAIMNALPIPALDGGRLFVTWIFRLAKKPLKQKTEELIHGAGFVFLMGLFVLITIVDVRRIF